MYCIDLFWSFFTLGSMPRTLLLQLSTAPIFHYPQIHPLKQHFRLVELPKVGCYVSRAGSMKCLELCRV